MFSVRLRAPGCVFSAILAALAGSSSAHASVYGSLSNFDVFNNSTGEYHGFEIELEDLTLAQVSGGGGRYYTYNNWHYGQGEVHEYDDGVSKGVRVTYRNPASAAAVTPAYSGAILPTNGHTCISISGCEHFGVVINAQPTATRYFWLDAAGNRVDQVNLQAPQWNVVQPALPPQNGQPAQPAIVEVEIEAPEIDPGKQRSDAVWVQVFKTEIEREVELEELMADQAVVPDEDQGQTEIEWKLMQRNPANPDSEKLGNNGGEEVPEAFKQVLRTYRFYAFAGTYDPENHESWCTPGENDCEDLAQTDANNDGEWDHMPYVGRPIGQQMAALNLDGLVVLGDPARVPLPGYLIGPLAVGLIGLSRRRFKRT